MLPPVDLSQTIEALENSRWGEPPFPSHVVTTCYALRKKPLHDFTVGDLRMMIGQQNNLPLLLPLALEHLRRNLLAEGDYYEGDLLLAVLKVDPEIWQLHPALKTELVICFEAQQQRIDPQDKLQRSFLEAFAVLKTANK